MPGRLVIQVSAPDARDGIQIEGENGFGLWPDARAVGDCTV